MIREKTERESLELWKERLDLNQIVSLTQLEMSELWEEMRAEKVGSRCCDAGIVQLD